MWDQVKEYQLGKVNKEVEGKADPHYNSVSKPFHYNHTDGIECIDYIKQVLGLEGFIAYCRGNVIKYNHRAFHKGNPTEDMSKAEWYLKQTTKALKELHK